MAVRWPISRPTLHRFLIGSAWFFIVVSLLFLAWAVAVLLPDVRGSDATFYQTMREGDAIKAVGLSYVGAPGLLLALTQSAIVISAAFATALRDRLWRRIGHIVLIVWAALWTINLFWLTSIDQMLMSYAQSGTMAVLLGCTVYRALVNWNNPRDRAGHAFIAINTDEAHSADEAPVGDEGAKLLTADDIGHSGRVQPIDHSDSKPNRPRIERAAQSTLRRSARVGRWTLRHVASTGNRSLNWLRNKGVLPGHGGSRATRSA